MADEGRRQWSSRRRRQVIAYCPCRDAEPRTDLSQRPATIPQREHFLFLRERQPAPSHRDASRVQVRAYGAAFDAELGRQLVHRLTSEVAIYQGVNRSRIEPLLHLPSVRNQRGWKRSGLLPNHRGTRGQPVDQGLCQRGQGWKQLPKLPPKVYWKPWACE